jgi:hypothetical protein
MKNSLENLFGSKDRWRMIKMFLLNSGESFSLTEVSRRTKVERRKMRRIISQLSKSGFITGRKRKEGWFFSVNKNYPFFSELKKLVIKSNIYPQCESLGKVKKLGDVKLSIITGVFINEPKVRTDLLIVGARISKAKMDHLLADLEAELGREVNYSLMDIEEFKYRANMFDKFIMEILEMPHEILVNKIPGVIHHLVTKKRRG